MEDSMVQEDFKYYTREEYETLAATLTDDQLHEVTRMTNRQLFTLKMYAQVLVKEHAKRGG